MRTARTRISGYLLMSFGFTWALAGIGAALGISTESGIGYVVLAGLCMLGPAAAALIQQRRFDGLPLSGLGLTLSGTRWNVLAATALIGLLIAPSYLLVQHLLGDILGWERFGHAEVSDERLRVGLTELLSGRGMDASKLTEGMLGSMPAWLVLVALQFAALLSAFSVNLLFMLGEELGWRGYLFQVTAHWSGLRRILFTGVAWGLWHAPLIAMGHNYPGHPIIGIGLMTVFCLLLAVLFDWTRARSGTIWSACILHGLINGTAGGTALFAWGGHPLIASIVGVAGMLVFALWAALVVALDGGYRRALLTAVQPSA